MLVDDHSRDSHWVLFSMVSITQFLRHFKTIDGTRYCVIVGIEAIPCPICGGRLYHYDSRERSVRIDEELFYYFLLRRLRCIDCVKIHLELPDFLLPRQRCFKSVIERAVGGTPIAIVKDPRTPDRWKRWWRIWQTYLKDALSSLAHREQMDSTLLDLPLFDLVSTLVNHRLWPFHLIWNRPRTQIRLHSP